MLGLAKRVKVKILQASTSKVYGDPTIHPQTEEYWATSIRSACAPAHDEGSDARRPYSSIIGDSTAYRSKWRGSHLWPGNAPERRKFFLRILLCKPCATK